MLQRVLPGVGLTLVVLAAALIALIGVPVISVIMVVGALCGYHLLRLRMRVAWMPRDQWWPFMRPHVRWLAATATLGLLIGGVALFVRARPSFSLLALLALLGIGLVTGAVRRVTKDHS